MYKIMFHLSAKLEKNILLSKLQQIILSHNSFIVSVAEGQQLIFNFMTHLGVDDGDESGVHVGEGGGGGLGLDDRPRH